MNNIHSALLILTMSLITILLRFLPFIVFSGKQKVPKIIIYLGNVLPSAAIGMLVVYCLKDISITTAPYGIKELVACLAVVITHIIKRNTIFSVLVGTVLYMILIQVL